MSESDKDLPMAIYTFTVEDGDTKEVLSFGRAVHPVDYDIVVGRVMVTCWKCGANTAACTVDIAVGADTETGCRCIEVVCRCLFATAFNNKARDAIRKGWHQLGGRDEFPLKVGTSREAGTYFANHCQTCGVIQGDMPLLIHTLRKAVGPTYKEHVKAVIPVEGATPALIESELVPLIDATREFREYTTGKVRPRAPEDVCDELEHLERFSTREGGEICMGGPSALSLLLDGSIELTGAADWSMQMNDIYAYVSSRERTLVVERHVHRDPGYYEPAWIYHEWSPPGANMVFWVQGTPCPALSASIHNSKGSEPAAFHDAILSLSESERRDILAQYFVRVEIDPKALPTRRMLSLAYLSADTIKHDPVVSITWIPALEGCEDQRIPTDMAYYTRVE